MKISGKKITVVALAIAVVLGSAGAVFAHGPHGKRGDRFQKWANMSDEERAQKMEERLDKRVARLDEKLDLSDAQEKKVRQILGAAQTEVVDIFQRARKSGDREAAHKEMKEVRQRTKKQLAAVLDADQLAKLKQIRQRRHHRFQGRMLERLDEKLQLTDQQHAQVKTILDETHGKLKALREQEGARGDKRKQARAILKDSADRIEKVLDAKQAKEFREMRKHMRQRARHFRHRHQAAPAR